MKKQLFVGALLALTLFPKAQGFFKPEEKIETGVYYYPEAWNPDQRDRDYQKMEDIDYWLKTEHGTWNTEHATRNK
jgi:hypothetical protein